jgi:GNAT superfamily N-acetyltransferase
MKFKILVSPEEVRAFVGRINTIADQNRDELGFLPHAAYRDLALKGQLWVVTTLNFNSILGYVAYGGSASALKISQLYVEPSRRGGGIGSSLLAALKEKARISHRQIVTARVAADLAANQFWEKQGFYVIRQIAGGKASGRTINIRVYDLPEASLLDAMEVSPNVDWLHGPSSDPLLLTPTYTLDLNVVFDVLHQRVDAEIVGRMFSTAFAGDLKLCVSSEFMVELARHARSPDADPLLKIARALPVLAEIDARSLQDLLIELNAIVFPKRDHARRNADNDASDLRHLATSIYHRVRGFVTRERAILTAATKLHEKFNLEVISPYELISPQALNPNPEVGIIGRHEKAPDLQSRLYADTASFQVRSLLKELGVSESVFDEVLRAGTTARSRTRFLVYSGARLLGVVSWDEPPLVRATSRYFLIVKEEGPEASLVVDHCIITVLQTLPLNKFARCELWTAKSQILTRETARRVGFSATLEGMGNLVGSSKRGYNGYVIPVHWKEFAKDFRASSDVSLPSKCPSFDEAISTGILLGKDTTASRKGIDLLTFESELSPLLVIAPGRRGAMVPIRDKQASELLPSVRLQNPLFDKEAISRIERAYFGRAAMSALLKRGDVVVFYVSGADHGRGEAVGLARITASGTGTPSQLHRDLIRQGVLSLDDLRQMAQKAGRVGFFTFDSFIKFKRGISFQEMKKLGCVSPANLITSQQLEPDQLTDLLVLAAS